MESRNVEEITATNVRIRSLVYEDIQIIRKWRNQDFVRKWFVHNSIITEEEQEKWWIKYKALRTDKMFVIEEKISDKPIGTVALYNIIYGQTAEFGRFMIGETWARGKGYGLEAIQLILRYAIEKLQCQKINLEVIKNNEVAIQIYLKIGFKIVEDKGDLLTLSIFSKGCDPHQFR